MHRNPERLGECPRNRADELVLALTVWEEPGVGVRGKLESTSTSRAFRLTLQFRGRIARGTRPLFAFQ